MTASDQDKLTIYVLFKLGFNTGQIQRVIPHVESVEIDFLVRNARTQLVDAAEAARAKFG